jgi:hypothetical protein
MTPPPLLLSHFCMCETVGIPIRIQGVFNVLDRYPLEGLQIMKLDTLEISLVYGSRLFVP